MPEPLQPEILDTLVCESASRPKGAPTIGEIVPAVRPTHRDQRQLTVTFDRGATSPGRRRRGGRAPCCSTITWQLETTDDPVLRILAMPGQLDVLEAIFSPSHPTP